MPVMSESQERILGWPVYRFLRLDQKVLSRFAEHIDVLLSLASGPPNPKSATVCHTNI